jgi:hypothetical protein
LRRRLYGGDAQLLEVGDLLHEPAIGAGMGDARARVAREPAHVELVDHGIGEGDAQRMLDPPVELLVHHARAQPLEAAVAARSLAPSLEAGDALAVGVDHDLRRIVAVDLRLRVRHTLQPIPVLDAGIETLQEDVPDVPGAVVLGVERQLEHGIAVAGKGDDEPHPRRVLREEREVDPVAPCGGAVGQRVAASHREVGSEDAEQTLVGPFALARHGERIADLAQYFPSHSGRGGLECYPPRA